MSISISQQLRGLLQRVEEAEKELHHGRSEIRRLTNELLETKQLLEFWKGQATNKGLDTIPQLIHDSSVQTSRTTSTVASANSHRLDVTELHDSIDELYCLPGDLPQILTMMDNILKCRKYYQSLWLDATCEVTQRFGHWTKLRLHARKLKGDTALSWYKGGGWAPPTKLDLKEFVCILLDLQEEFEALCELEPQLPLRD